MIRRIGLKNWRAYESAVIPFESGTTFIVAPNGIGKTSLLEAAQFALTGDSTGLVAPVLLHEDHAEVELALQLPAGRVVVIHRTLYADTTKPSTFSATAGDDELTEAQFVVELDDAFGADPGFIARNAFLRDSLRNIERFDLRSLLARAYQLDTKRAEADRLKKLAADLEAEAKELSRTIRSEAKETARLEAELDAATKDLERSRQTLTEIRSKMDDLTVARTAFMQHAAATQRVHEWQTASMAVVDRAKTFVLDVTVDRLLSDVETLAAQAEADASALQERAAATRARIQLIEDALSDLESAGGDCPVCLRPLSLEDRDTAASRHRAEVEQLRAELAGIDITTATSKVQSVRQLMREADSLGPRPAEPPELGDASIDPQAQYDQVRTELEQAAAAQQAIESRIEQLTSALTEARDTEEKAAQSERTWRRWALTSAAATTLSQSVDDVLRNEVDPVAKAVGERWNSLFADRPHLWFDLEGDLWRELGDRRLPIDAFSTGERASARLLMQLAILTTATKVDFCWFDEPLEHLDPRTRRRIAGMLSHGRKATGLRQLVVTTYEEELAQELADADELTAIEYVRAGPANQPV
jgi:DNA repair exonuclease SbcCD ATPase subunit